MIVVDAKDMIIGRLSTHVAKMVLSGDQVRVVNCEQAVISGMKENIVEDYARRLRRGIPMGGPYYPRNSDRIMRRTVRGMLPFDTPRGKAAYKNLLCYTGVPEEFANNKLVVFKDAHKSASKARAFTTLKEVVDMIGGKR